MRETQESNPETTGTDVTRTEMPRFVLVVGTTDTARIEGISAAGASPDRMVHTPAADAELVEYGRPVRAPVTPVSPDGCPTPALVTRAVRDLLGFETLVVDAGLATRTGVPTVDLGAKPGGDIRETDPVPATEGMFDSARELGRLLPDEELVVGESIPGGTTTALGVLTALGESYGVSSSLPENPIELKERVVARALAASGLDDGGAAGEPHRALRAVGDPVLAAVSGLTVGAVESGTAVTLAGGTQMVAVAALVRHLGVTESLTLATTQFVADDDTADLQTAADDLDFALTATDPGFPASEHVAFEQYCRGVAKEGAGMGGALALLARSDTSLDALHDRIVARYEEVLADDGD